MVDLVGEKKSMHNAWNPANNGRLTVKRPAPATFTAPHPLVQGGLRAGLEPKRLGGFQRGFTRAVTKIRAIVGASLWLGTATNHRLNPSRCWRAVPLLTGVEATYPQHSANPDCRGRWELDNRLAQADRTTTTRVRKNLRLGSQARKPAASLDEP